MDMVVIEKGHRGLGIRGEYMPFKVFVNGLSIDELQDVIDGVDIEDNWRWGQNSRVFRPVSNVIVLGGEDGS